jgi:hypothetical protein
LYERVEDLLSQMTLREKVSLLAGTKMWYTVPVKRLGISSLKMTDGPNGALCWFFAFHQAIPSKSHTQHRLMKDHWNNDLR